MEVNLSKKTYWNEIIYFLSGMNMEFISMPMVLGKISWKVTIVLSLIINLMNSFRYTSFDRNKEMHFYPLYQYSQNSILLSLSAYFFEKLDRESFYRIKSYEFSLSRFKDMITNIFPNAIIIMKDKKILFHNKETLSALECEDEEEIIDILSRLKLEEHEDSDRFETEGPDS